MEFNLSLSNHCVLNKTTLEKVGYVYRLFLSLHAALLCYMLLATSIVAIMLLNSKKRAISHTVKSELAPLANCRVPYLEHTLAFIRGRGHFASTLLLQSSVLCPNRFALPGFNITLVRGSTNIRSFLNESDVFINSKAHAHFLRRVLGASPRAVAVVANDMTGIAIKPIGAHVPENQRINRMQHQNTFAILSRTGVGPLLEHFVQSYEQRISSHSIGEHWVSFPDLYLFLRSPGFGATIDALCGPSLLKLSPDFETSFWEFDSHADYLNKFPAWLSRSSTTARSRCLGAVLKWRRAARATSEDRAYADDVLWDEIWGLKCMRLRNEMYAQFTEFDEVSCAASDLGVIWGYISSHSLPQQSILLIEPANAFCSASINTAPAVYWFLLTMLRTPSLFARCRTEMRRGLLPANAGSGAELPHFDTNVLMKQPLLQSLLCEVFRTKVATKLARHATVDHNVGGYLIPQDSLAFVSLHVEHMDARAWGERPGGGLHPVEEIWPERFLECGEGSTGEVMDMDASPRFSTKGLESQFLPFGKGIHQCPGKNFARREILVVVAMLIEAFEIELAVGEDWEQGDHLQSYGYSTLRPLKVTPIRIRRRVKA